MQTLHSTLVGTAALLIVVMLTGSAGAQPAEGQVSADYMMEGCVRYLNGNLTRARTAFRAGACVGVLNTLVWIGSSFVPHLRFCPPEGVTTEQAVSVVVRYIEARPESIDDPFAGLAVLAFQKAWPCRR